MKSRALREIALIGRRCPLVTTAAVLLGLALPAAAFAGPGDPDPSFSGDGQLTTGFGTTPFHAADSGEAVARDGSGRIYIAGTTPANGGDFAVVRLSSTGALDTTFGANGIVNADVSGSGSQDRGNSVAVDSAGNVVVAGTTDVFSQESEFAVVRYTSSGVLDTTFGGGDGIVTADFAGFEDDARGVAVLSGDRLAVAGTTDTDADPEDEVENFDFAVAVYTSAGALDGNIDGDGLVTTDFGSEQDEANAVVATGINFVVGGRMNPDGDGGDGGDFALARYVGSTGALDSGFDGDGKQTVNFAGASFANPDNLEALAVDSTGRVVAAGSAPSATNSDFAVARLTTGGALDTAGFSGDGKATVDFPSASSADRGLAVAIGSSDSVVVAGQTGTENGSVGAGAQFLLAKLESDGDPDPAFGGGDGLVTTDFKPASDLNDEATGVLVDATKIVATGTGNDNFAAARYDVGTGALDTTFGSLGTGKVETDIVSPVASSEAGRDVAVQPDGKAVVVGQTNAGPTSQFEGDAEFGVARYNADGSLDQAFGVGGHEGDGRIATNFDTFPDTSGTQDSPTAVALQSDGKIVVAGNTDPITSDNGDFAVARYEPDGDLDTSFGGGDGLVTTDFGGTDRDLANGIAITGAPGDPGFRIVVVGARRNAFANEDFAIAVYDEDGDPDASFDGDGRQTTNLDLGDTGNAVAIQADGKIVAAGISGVGTGATTQTDFGMVRYTTTGNPDSAFGGGDGIVTEDIATSFDQAFAVAVRELGAGEVRIVLGGRTSQGGSASGALAAYTTDGTLDSSFSPGGAEGDGKAIYDLQFFSTGADLRDAVFQPDGKIVASGTIGADSFGLIRVDAAGALDPSFGGDGRVSTAFPNPSSQQSAFGLALQSDGKIVAAGGALSPFNGSDFFVARYGTTDAPPLTPPSQPPAATPPASTPKKKCKKGFVKKKVKGKKKCVRKKKRK